MSPGNPLSQRAGWAGGQPISYLMHLALARPELISLAAGFVDQATLPDEATRQAAEALLSDRVAAHAALQYGTTAGHPPLRKQILARMIHDDGLMEAESNLTIDQVIVTAGSNQLLHLVGDTLLDPGDIVLCSAPSYFVFLGMLTNLGARAVGVAADHQGMIPEALEEQLVRIEEAGELAKVKAVYVTTYYDNPSGVTLAAERRPRIVEIVKRWSKKGRLYLIEDAAYRELRYEADLPSLRAFDPEGDTVVVAGTFSKSYSPGIRIGWGIVPPLLVEPLKHQKGNIDFGSPNFAQHLMAKVLDSGLFDRHVERLRQSYRLKLQAMLKAADEFLTPIPGVKWVEPRGGLYVWLRLPEEIDTGSAGRLLNAALDEGVLYVPGRYCYPNEGEPARDNMIRLSFGVQSAENIRRGVQALAEAIRVVMTG